MQLWQRQNTAIESSYSFRINATRHERCNYDIRNNQEKRNKEGSNATLMRALLQQRIHRATTTLQLAGRYIATGGTWLFLEMQRRRKRNSYQGHATSDNEGMQPYFLLYFFDFLYPVLLLFLGISDRVNTSK
jgi:hypothetical protein